MILSCRALVLSCTPPPTGILGDFLGFSFFSLAWILIISSGIKSVNTRPVSVFIRNTRKHQWVVVSFRLVKFHRVFFTKMWRFKSEVKGPYWWFFVIYHLPFLTLLFICAKCVNTSPRKKILQFALTVANSPTILRSSSLAIWFFTTRWCREARVCFQSINTKRRRWMTHRCCCK